MKRDATTPPRCKGPGTVENSIDGCCLHDLPDDHEDAPGRVCCWCGDLFMLVCGSTPHGEYAAKTPKVTHLGTTPFKALCHKDEPGLKTNDDPQKVDCVACLRIWAGGRGRAPARECDYCGAQHSLPGHYCQACHDAGKR